MSNKRAALEEVNFHRLPEEIIIYIFSMVFDLKSLFMLSLVSKYFASLVSHVRTVSISIPDSGPHSVETCNTMYKLFCMIHNLRSLRSDQIPAFIDGISLPTLEPPVFLEKFSKLESVYLEFSSTGKLDNSSLIKWKVKWGDTDVEVKTFVGMLPVSVCKKTEYEHEQEHMRQAEMGFMTSQVSDCLRLSLGYYMEWSCRIAMLVRSHSSIQSVTITDSEKQGKWVLRGKRLAYMRNCWHKEKMEENIIEYVLRVAWVPLLELPLSGYIMRDVCLVMMETFGSGDYDSIMNLDFEEHENVLGEAVKEILKNHRDRIFE